MDELSPSARALLRVAGSSDDPTSDDAERVRHAVLTRVGAIGIGTAALATATSTAHAKGLLGAFSAKVGAALVVLVGSTATVTYVATQASDSKTALVVAPANTAKARAVGGSEKAAPISEATPLQVEDLPTLQPAPRRARSAARAAEPEVALPVAPAPPAEEAKSDGDLQAEMQLIRGADSALRAGRANDALVLLSRHADEHPKGLLAQEREGLRLIARCQSGSRASAAPAAERFLERAPRSPLSTRMRTACGIER